MTKRAASGAPLLLVGLFLAAACATAAPTGFAGGGPSPADGGITLGDGTIITRGPDGSTIVTSIPDTGTFTIPGVDGTFTVSPDGSLVSVTPDAASQADVPPPPPVTPCDLCVAAGGTCSASSVCTLTENPGNISAGTQAQLKAGGNSDSAFGWLYPYDKTIFPRAVPSPTLQFGGAAPSAVWVHVSFPEMTYDGFFGPSTAPLGGGQATISAAAWTALEALATATDVVSVSITKISGGNVAGPITRSWSIAQGQARGTIYYETYGSKILGGIGSVGIMKIQPGATAPTAVKSGCGNVCHTASADGSTLVANTALAFGSASYDLKNNASTIFAAGGEIFTYGGLYPDGTFEMSATNYRTWIGAPSRLYDTKTGANIPAPGWDGVIKNAGTASFSPDGKYIAFNHEDSDNGAGHTLSTMAFTLANHGFSNRVDVANDPARTLAWPAWTPDDASIVYHAGSNAAFETDDTSDAGVGTTGDVYLVDTATKTSVRLDNLDGYNAGGASSYLPANDPNLSFAPTVLPEAVGGYFWVVFTSHRSYGNTSPSKDNGGVNGKLWVAAIDIGAPPGTDASHPAFFLQGQELTSDNLRGFWVVDPCRAAGSECTGGDQCCQGYCRASGGAYVCVGQPVQGCANDLARCVKSSDCCTSTDQCINNRCAVVAPK